jgi:glucose-1-phosphate cytidylyltransferase
MKVVILAGGFGSRLSEETVNIPKPMVRIGSMPIIWHIMKNFSKQGHKDFIICLGYKSEVVKKFFMDYHTLNSDITINLNSNDIKYHNYKSEDWKISLIDTGLNTLTGGRLKRVKDYVNNEPFLLTYGDGVSNVNLEKLIESHMKMKKICTVTSVKPPGRFGILNVNPDGLVSSFDEKRNVDSSLINGGFFVCEPSIFDLIEGDETSFEFTTLKDLAVNKQLNSCAHNGFWKPMDTLRDKNELNKLWESNLAPWKIW